jgi:hypothetical protein
LPADLLAGDAGICPPWEGRQNNPAVTGIFSVRRPENFNGFP